MRILAIGTQCANTVKFATSADVEIAFVVVVFFVCVFSPARARLQTLAIEGKAIVKHLAERTEMH